jgi:ribosomal protein L17
MIEQIVPKLLSRNGGYTSQLKYSQDFNTLDQSVVMIVQD